MMKKVLAIVCTLITLFVLYKEWFLIFGSNDADMAGKKPILIVIALSISLPLIFLSIWLWKPKYKRPVNPHL